MRARSVIAVYAVALVVAASAGANFQASTSVAQGAITSGSLAPANLTSATVNLSLCVRNGSYPVDLVWSGSTTSGVSGYLVFDRFPPTTTWTQVTASPLTPGTTTYRVGNLSNWGGATEFMVRALRLSWTQDSNVLSATGPTRQCH